MGGKNNNLNINTRKEKMKLLTVKKCKEILKERYNLKGISRYNKQQLNNLLFSCSNKEYLKRHGVFINKR